MLNTTAAERDEFSHLLFFENDFYWRKILSRKLLRGISKRFSQNTHSKVVENMLHLNLYPSNSHSRLMNILMNKL